MCYCRLWVGILIVLIACEPNETKNSGVEQDSLAEGHQPGNSGGSHHASRHKHGLKSRNNDGAEQRIQRSYPTGDDKTRDFIAPQKAPKAPANHYYSPPKTIKAADLDKCSDDCDIEVEKILRIEQIRQQIMKETGLSSFPNMSAINVTQNDFLQHLINITNNQWAQKDNIAFQDHFDLDELILGDEPESYKLETAFVLASEGPRLYKIGEGFKHIYFNLSKEHASEISQAVVSIWIEPLQHYLLAQILNQKKGQSAFGLGMEYLYDRMIQDENAANGIKNGRKQKKKRRKDKRKSDNNRKGNGERKDEKEQTDKYDGNSLPKLLLKLFRIETAPANEILKTEIIQTVTITAPVEKGQWINITFSEEDHEWLTNDSLNLGFLVQVTTEDGSLNIPFTGYGEDQHYTPLMNLTLIRDVYDRNKRYASNRICSDDKVEDVCCRYPLRVNFLDLNWDFIVAPKSYEANYCRGECPFLYAHKYPHSTIVQQRFNDSNSKIGPCCGARHLEPLKMLYYDNEARIKLSTIRDMVVKQCGCT